MLTKKKTQIPGQEKRIEKKRRGSESGLEVVTATAAGRESEIAIRTGAIEGGRRREGIDMRTDGGSPDIEFCCMPKPNLILKVGLNLSTYSHTVILGRAKTFSIIRTARAKTCLFSKDSD